MCMCVYVRVCVSVYMCVSVGDVKSEWRGLIGTYMNIKGIVL